MTVLEIVKEFLELSGYDGLYNSEIQCGCELVDLAPCDGYFGECRPGYKTRCRCGEGCDWDISPTKDEENWR